MSRIYGTGIVRSMVIAYKNLFRPRITLQYPHEKAVLPERSRWAVAQKYYDDGDTKCTACMACEKACPDYIIKIDVTTAEDRTKHINHWYYEVGGCMMCGLCVEACPFDAIEMSHNYELARIDPASLVEDLLTDVPADQPKKRLEKACAAPDLDPAAATAPAAEKPAAPAAPAQDVAAESPAPTAAAEPKGEGHDG